MADPEEAVPEGDPPADPQEEPAEGSGIVDAFLDCLFPAGSFKGPDNASNLAFARCVMLIFYLVYTGVLVFMIYQLVFSGKIEVYQTTYKFDRIEAPSFAICPFNPNVGIRTPDNRTLPHHVAVRKYDRGGFTGFQRLKVEPQRCHFDRTCVCVEYAHSPGTQFFKDHDRSSPGTDGSANGRSANFRDRLEVQTNLTDGSGEHALKVGLYDNWDKSPEWFYVGQGGYMLGTVELREWIVHDYSFAALWKTVHGDWTAMFTQRHMFHFTGAPVGRALNQTENSTIFSYEMKDFFVQATMSSSSSISLFTLGYLVFLILVRSAVVGIFTQIMFPEYDPKKDEVKVRELSGTSDCIMTCCCCCCRRRGKSDGDTDEAEPLLGGAGAAEAPAESSA